jgi:hypothetical protein
MPRFPLFAFLLACVAFPAPVDAQHRGAPLPKRMQAFTETATTEPPERVAEFFPRRGSWTWVQTVHYPGRPDRLRIRRFTPAETLLAIDTGGVACESFLRTAGTGISGVLMEYLGLNPWRRVGRTRFVPPDAKPGSKRVFVDWRLEDGRWVISSYGDEAYERPRLLGVPLSTVRRDPVQQPLRLPLPADGHYAAAEPWYPTHESLRFEGRYYVKYAYPAVFRAGEITRIASWGRVGVYAETGVTEYYGALYVPVNARGEFQRYLNEHDGPPPSCR